MIACYDSAVQERFGIEVPYVLGRGGAGGKSEREIEVAVVEGSVPGHGNLVSAHERSDGIGVESILEDAHVSIKLFFAFEVSFESSDGNVCDGVEVGEVDSESVVEFAVVIVFERGLFGR